MEHLICTSKYKEVKCTDTSLQQGFPDAWPGIPYQSLGSRQSWYTDRYLEGAFSKFEINNGLIIGIIPPKEGGI